MTRTARLAAGVGAMGQTYDVKLEVIIVSNKMTQIAVLEHYIHNNL
jgi:hypothetical protein